jgi:archaemetzincin
VTALIVSAIGPLDPVWLSVAAACLENEMNVPVTLRDPLPEPHGAFDEKRHQYSAVSYLETVVRAAPPLPGRLVGVTTRDIYIPMLTFLFGQAQLRGSAALVSLARLQQSFYGLPDDAALTSERLRKEILHEAGHTFGLVHCADRECAMSLSTSIRQVDEKKDSYCRKCRHILRTTL